MLECHQLLVLGVAVFQKRAECGRKRERSPFLVLRRAGFKPHFASVEVDLSPFERQHFAVDAPAGDVAECHHVMEIVRQMRLDASVLLGLEEPRAHVVFFQHRDIRPLREPATFDRQRERVFEDLQLAIDLGVRDVSDAVALFVSDALPLSVHGEVDHVIPREAREAPIVEIRAKVFFDPAVVVSRIIRCYLTGNALQGIRKGTPVH